MYDLPHGGVQCGKHCISDRNRFLPSNVADDLLEVVCLDCSLFHPGCEMTGLAVQAVIGKAHFRSNKEDFLVCEENTTVVSYILKPRQKVLVDMKFKKSSWSTHPVSHAHAHINEHIFGYRVLEDLGDHLPAVEEGIAFHFCV